MSLCRWPWGRASESSLSSMGEVLKEGSGDADSPTTNTDSPTTNPDITDISHQAAASSRPPLPTVRKLPAQGQLPSIDECVEEGGHDANVAGRAISPHPLLNPSNTAIDAEHIVSATADTSIAIDTSLFDTIWPTYSAMGNDPSKPHPLSEGYATRVPSPPGSPGSAPAPATSSGADETSTPDAVPVPSSTTPRVDALPSMPPGSAGSAPAPATSPNAVTVLSSTTHRHNALPSIHDILNNEKSNNNTLPPIKIIETSPSATASHTEATTTPLLETAGNPSATGDDTEMPDAPSSPSPTKLDFSSIEDPLIIMTPNSQSVKKPPPVDPPPMDEESNLLLEPYKEKLLELSEALANLPPPSRDINVLSHKDIVKRKLIPIGKAVVEVIKDRADRGAMEFRLWYVYAHTHGWFGYDTNQSNSKHIAAHYWPLEPITPNTHLDIHTMYRNALAKERALEEQQRRGLASASGGELASASDGASNPKPKRRKIVEDDDHDPMDDRPEGF